MCFRPFYPPLTVLSAGPLISPGQILPRLLSPNQLNPRFMTWASFLEGRGDAATQETELV